VRGVSRTARGDVPPRLSPTLSLHRAHPPQRDGVVRVKGKSGAAMSSVTFQSNRGVMVPHTAVFPLRSMYSASVARLRCKSWWRCWNYAKRALAILMPMALGLLPVHRRNA
jgi:hypothetical protein